MTTQGPATHGSRGWTVLLVALALLLPLGSLLQPWVWPSRSHLPIVDRQLHASILLVTVAGLRADRVHHLGYPVAVTPALDRVAADGVSFPMYYANGNEAAVTLAAMFTGSCPAANGVRAPADRLPDGAATLAERLRETGYATRAIIADPDLAERGLQQGFQDFRLLAGASAPQVLDAALAALAATPQGNAFVWADLADLLPPYGGPALDNRRFAPDAPADFGATLQDYDIDPAGRAARGWGPRQPVWMEARYVAALAELDAAIGRCLDQLAADGRLEHLTLCIAGTRGEILDQPAGRSFAHGCDLTDAALHVPLLLRFPGTVYRGLEPRRLAQSTDIASTLADIGAHRAWPTPQGRSLAPVVLYQQRVDKSVFAEGLVQPDRSRPAWRGVVQRLESLKALFDGAGTLRGAWRVLEDPLERDPVELNADYLKVLAGQADWPAACLRG